MHIKTALMLGLYFLPWTFIVFAGIESYGINLLLWVVMAFGMIGLGLGITHDANHGAYSAKKKVNDQLGALLNLIGGNHHTWKVQHNLKHHTYTNIQDHDEDMTNPVLRFSPTQAWKPHHRFQAWYAPLFYAIMSIYWLIRRDFLLVNRYAKEDLLRKVGTNRKKALTYILVAKGVYVILFIVLPILGSSLPWWQVMLGFLSMHMVAGSLLALIFQTGHAVEDTTFFEDPAQGSMEYSWAVHQLHTTANYANNNPALSWFIGGLNYQIEHHLFPNTCHIHYRAISRIVKKTAGEFEVPYHEVPTFWAAIKSHFQHLNRLGKGEERLENKGVVSKLNETSLQYTPGSGDR